ncbi:MAG: DUF4232 domain-containing protein [Chloroflexi bacterium]|nr:DUF4232 domain-containing protein [Chloroflexota bacterium]
MMGNANRHAVLVVVLAALIVGCAAPGRGGEQAAPTVAPAVVQGSRTPEVGANEPTSPGVLPAAGAAGQYGPTLQTGISPSFVDSDHGWIAVGRILLTTEDGGQHWTKLYESEQFLGVVDFVSPQHGFLAGNDALLVTKDGGRSWSGLPMPARGFVHFVDFVDGQHGWAIVTGPHKERVIFRSTDGGATWTALTDPCPHPQGKLPPGPFRFIDVRTGWIACAASASLGFPNLQLFRTDDGGDYWSLVAALPDSEPPPSGVMTADALQFMDPQRGWMLNGRGLFATRDGGHSWEARATFEIIVPGSLWRGATVEFTSASTGYLAYSRDRQWGLFATRAGGTSWTQVYPQVAPETQACTPADLEAVLPGYNGAMQSSVSNVVLTNQSGRACSLTGTMGILLEDAQSQPLPNIQWPTERDAGDQSVTLQPGQRVSIFLRWPNECAPRREPGANLFVVLPPDGGRVPVTLGPRAEWILACTAPPSGPHGGTFEPLDPPY